MALWTNVDNPAGRPKYANTAATLGISPAEKAALPGPAHAGWNRTTQGTGPVLSVTVGAAGTGYSNGAATFTGGGGTGAAGTILTNGAGGILSITITNGGSGYTTPPTVSGAGGTGATLTAVMGGRSGRVQHETLVAMGSIA